MLRNNFYQKQKGSLTDQSQMQPIREATNNISLVIYKTGTLHAQGSGALIGILPYVTAVVPDTPKCFEQPEAQEHGRDVSMPCVCPKHQSRLQKGPRL